MSTAIAPGTVFGGYRIESLLGRGGMGVVYRATDLSLDRPVALKLIAPDLADDGQFRQRFLKEPKLAAALDHPHVVPIYEAGEVDGQLYLAMRFVEGSDLRTVLEEGIGPERLLGILAQVADALDAAHRRDLVHRDVKPANVLLDGDDHAYLTDFGITKRVGSDSTRTGQLVGTLDYMAPEQVRGEAVDGRADGYSLACVLYEGLAGAPPFRRASAPETMWAQMHDPPPPLKDAAADAVLQRALAKEPADRFGTCGELVAAARAALDLTPSAPGLLGRPALQRRRHLILGAGVATLAAAVVAAILVMSDHSDAPAAPSANGVAALDGRTGRLTSLTKAATAPSNVAVGEGAIWVLNTEHRTISRIDPKTRKVMRSFETGRVPSDIAAGAGAVWVGNVGGREHNSTMSISRIDPRTTRVTRTVKLPGAKGDSRWPSVGFPGIAVGDGGVWAINPDKTISRIDPATGRIVAKIPAAAWSIGAGDAGVWFTDANRPAVRRIDPRTNRVGQTIAAPAGVLLGVAVGAGSVWATGTHEGLVWRFEPGSPPLARSIEAGGGVSFIAFGAGAVWAANDVQGKLLRIDPATNQVTARVLIGATQALAAGSGSAWVSVAGEARDGALPASACSEIAAGGRRPDVVIVSDLPLHGKLGAGPRAMADAIRVVFRDHDFRAGRFAVGYQSCDASTAQSGSFEGRRCSANANAYARAKSVVALIGPYNSQCAAIEIPILNAAPGGPLAMISPSNTYPGLTRHVSLPAAWGGYRNEPEVFYPTGTRHYVRLGTGDDLIGAAAAVHAKRIGVRSAYLLDDGLGLFDVLVTNSFRRAAHRLGVRISGAQRYDPGARSYDAVAATVARSGAQSVVIGGNMYQGGARLLKALRARLGPRVPIMTGFGFQPVKDALKLAGRAALGLYLSNNNVPGAARDLGPAGHQFLRDIGTSEPLPWVLEAGQAAQVTLHAVAHSDGTRASVLQALRQTEVNDGILGSFRFDRNGDITRGTMMISRITGTTPPGKSLGGDFDGAVLERIVHLEAGSAG